MKLPLFFLLASVTLHFPGFFYTSLPLSLFCWFLVHWLTSKCWRLHGSVQELLSLFYSILSLDKVIQSQGFNYCLPVVDSKINLYLQLSYHPELGQVYLIIWHLSWNFIRHLNLYMSKTEFLICDSFSLSLSHFSKWCHHSPKSRNLGIPLSLLFPFRPFIQTITKILTPKYIQNCPCLCSLSPYSKAPPPLTLATPVVP